MCLLIVSPVGHAVPREHLENGLSGNKDGWGIWHGGVTYRGLKEKKFWKAYDRLKLEPEVDTTPLVIHFRLATHGVVSTDNCHPAPMKNGGALFHNGIISWVNERKGESDTRAFARLLGNAVNLRDPEMLNFIREAIGTWNKLVIVHDARSARSPLSIINEKQGDWDGGIWYSNTCYKWKRYTVTSGGNHGRKSYGEAGSYLSELMGASSAAPITKAPEPGKGKIISPAPRGRIIQPRESGFRGVHDVDERRETLICPSDPWPERKTIREALSGVPDAPAGPWSLGGAEDRALEKAIGKDLDRRGFDRSEDKRFRRGWKDEN